MSGKRPLPQLTPTPGPADHAPPPRQTTRPPGVPGGRVRLGVKLLSGYIQNYFGMLRVTTQAGFGDFRYKPEKLNDFEIDEFCFKEVHCRRILECFCDDPEIHLTKNPLIALILTDAENTTRRRPGPGTRTRRGKWFRMFTEYQCAFSIINKKPELMRGDDGYEEELREDAETMQCHLGKCRRVTVLVARRCENLESVSRDAKTATTMRQDDRSFARSYQDSSHAEGSSKFCARPAARFCAYEGGGSM